MTKEELIKIVDEYNNNNDEHVSLKFHSAEYYALVYERWDSVPITERITGHNYNGIISQKIESKHYVVFHSEEDRDRFIKEETYREFSNSYYSAKAITKKELEKLGYTVKIPHLAFRYFNDKGELVLGYTEECQKALDRR